MEISSMNSRSSPFVIVGSLLVFSSYPLTADVDRFVVTDQSNPAFEDGACDRKWEIVDIAHINEAVGVDLETHVDPVPSPESPPW